MLSRLDNIAADSSGTTQYASYFYVGASTIDGVGHPAVKNFLGQSSLGLTYDPDGDGSFAGWDQFGQVTDQKWTFWTNTVDEYQYGYDYNGNRLYRANTRSTAKSEFYTYDALDRVTDRQQGTLNGGDTGISGTPAWEQTFTLDELGNWSGYVSSQSGSTVQSQTRAHNAVNETGTITHVTGSTTWVNPTYDAAGNMVSGPQPGNEATNLKFIYDAWNRLVQVTDNSNTIIVTYRYDGQGHRIQKLLGSNPSSPTSYYDYYYNENWQVLEEDKNGSANPYNQYVWDARYIDAPVLRFYDSNTDGTVDDTLYYCTDANMNVTALVADNGSVAERYTYDGYGQVHIFDGSWTSISSSAFDNQILFGGYRYDPESGLYHVRNRMYHPTLGRWNTFEPGGAHYDDGANLYAAFGNNPIASVDSSGLTATTSTTAPAAPAINMGAAPSGQQVRGLDGDIKAGWEVISLPPPNPDSERVIERNFQTAQLNDGHEEMRSLTKWINTWWEIDTSAGPWQSLNCNADADLTATYTTTTTSSSQWSISVTAGGKIEDVNVGFAVGYASGSATAKGTTRTVTWTKDKMQKCYQYKIYAVAEFVDITQHYVYSIKGRAPEIDEVTTLKGPEHTGNANFVVLRHKCN